MQRTKKCVKCLKRKAVYWNGYVKADKQYIGKRIRAGWCRQCRPYNDFWGHWLASMGKESCAT